MPLYTLYKCYWISNLLHACSIANCVWLCYPTDYSAPGFSIHGIFQARILEWVAISSSRASSWFRDRIHISCSSCIDKQILYHCPTWEAPPNLLYLNENSYLEGWLLQFPCKNKIPPISTPWGTNMHHTFLKFAHNTGQVVNEAINYTMSEVLNITLFSWPHG